MLFAFKLQRTNIDSFYTMIYIFVYMINNVFGKVLLHKLKIQIVIRSSLSDGDRIDIHY